MSRRTQIYVLVSLLASLGWLLISETTSMFRGSGGAPAVVASNAQFKPLDIREPDLRLDLLEKIHNTKYTGMQRDIFSGQPLPPAPSVATATKTGKTGAQVDPGPQQPPPPPPVQVPAQFFGYASRPDSNDRVAFFLNGDKVLIVAEGDAFLGNFRLLHIGNQSALVQEISTGRQTSVPLEQPPNQAAINP
jgi:hypothetical protein